jgi:hypothetical protein
LAGEQRSWVAVEFKWSLIGDPVRADDRTWKTTMNMTLGTRLTSNHHARSPWLKDEALQEHLQNPPSAGEAPFPWAPFCSAAFQTKQFTLIISRGSYILPWNLFTKRPYPLFQRADYRWAPSRYRWQLEFDISPYPLREEWAEDVKNGMPGGALDYGIYWERKKFVRTSIAKEDQTWAETLDLSWWLSPTTGHARKFV